MQNSPYTNPTGGCSPSRARLRLQNCPSPGPNHRTSHDRAPSGRLNQPRAIPGKRGPTSGQATSHRGRQQSNGNGALEQATGHRGRQQTTGAGSLPTPIGGFLPRCGSPGPRPHRRWPSPFLLESVHTDWSVLSRAGSLFGPLVHRRQPAPAQRNPSAPRCPHSSTARSASTWTCAPWVVLTAMPPLSQRYHTSQAL